MHSDAKGRIQKMQQAIKTEAQQRARQIVENAREEADLEKAKLFNAEKDRMDREQEQKIKQLQINSRMSSPNK